MGSKHVFENEGTGTKFEGTFQEMLTDVIAGTLAKDENITQTMLSNYNTTADEIYVDRDAVMGVDLNDEAMNMMQFQKAYSAACRLMTTYDSMLEKLINGMAI
jgi:flagellar hook-associated protein 1 FlgK